MSKPDLGARAAVMQKSLGELLKAIANEDENTAMASGLAVISMVGVAVIEIADSAERAAVALERLA